MSTNSFILIHSKSLHRVESRYKNDYKYRKVAQRHADEYNVRIHAEYVKDMKNLKDATKLGHKGYKKPVYDPAVVMETMEYAAAVAGMGEWKHNLTNPNGKKVWIPFDTAACCDVSTESYWCM